MDKRNKTSIIHKIYNTMNNRNKTSMIHKINNTMDNRNKNINDPQDKQHNGQQK